MNISTVMKRIEKAGSLTPREVKALFNLKDNLDDVAREFQDVTDDIPADNTDKNIDKLMLQVIKDLNNARTALGRLIVLVKK